MNTLHRILSEKNTKEEKVEIVAAFFAWILCFAAFMSYVCYCMIH